MNTHLHADSSLAMHAILARQRAAFLRDGAPALAQRKGDLQKLKRIILARKSDIGVAISADFGHRSTHETTMMEVMTLIMTIKHQHRHLHHWMKPLNRHVPLHLQPGRAWVQHQPLGVVGIISPWNYPLSLALAPLATAIAAGNRAMIKPSEITPATSTLIARMLSDIFDEEQVAVIMGDAAVGQEFSSLAFDHLVFTGSTQVGRKIMKSASDNLVPVTLELGGKSPAIIDKGYSPEQAAASIAHGKLVNAGQTCIAPDYVLVHEDALEAFVQAYHQAVCKLYPQGAVSDDFSSIVNAHHFSRLNALLDDARTKGAKVMAVGMPSDGVQERPCALAPMVVLNATGAMRVMQEEIFGPVLPVVGFRDIDGAIAHVNAQARPLALYLFSHDQANCRKVMLQTTSGNVTINNTLLHYAVEDLPFGGVGASGIGAYHGIEGFYALSHAKGIFQQGRWNLSGLLRPPFGKIADIILTLMLR